MSRSWPLRAVLRTVLAAVVLLGLMLLHDQVHLLVPGTYASTAAAAALVAAALAGLLTIQSGVRLLTHGMDAQASVLVRNLASWTLYALLGLWLVSSTGVNLSGLLVGGAILGVVVATASQASLGNFFAGLLLLLGRPYQVGTPVRLQGPALGSAEYEGTVVDIGALYTTLTTAGGEVLKLPNSAVVSSALLLGEAPLQAQVDLELPAGTPLRPIERALRARLGPTAGEVSIRPKLLNGGPSGKLLCQVQVRSTTPVDLAIVAEALAQAVTDAASPTPLIRQ